LTSSGGGGGSTPTVRTTVGAGPLYTVKTVGEETFAGDRPAAPVRWTLRVISGAASAERYDLQIFSIRSDGGR